MDFLRTVAASALGFLVVQFLTAWLKSRFNHATFLESERTDDVTSISSTVAAAVEEATDYWSRDALKDEAAIEARIVAAMPEISTCIEGLFQNRIDLRGACDLELDRFEDALTRGDFGSTLRQAEPQRLSEIINAGNRLKRKVRTCRRKLKPVWFSRH
ncbi:hypothetical protein [Roseivivax sp. THAF197b]|uniref:hypothetical protein n=1 Tax=Roseivivax sp. THAF197b TaxID=2588299 RepID=UPI0012691845|nr:hypothetical protein [Roseivivax sp. THAF197b]